MVERISTEQTAEWRQAFAINEVLEQARKVSMAGVGPVTIADILELRRRLKVLDEVMAGIYPAELVVAVGEADASTLLANAPSTETEQ